MIFEEVRRGFQFGIGLAAGMFVFSLILVIVLWFLRKPLKEELQVFSELKQKFG